MSLLFKEPQKILIVGDAILDIYHFGKVDRVSPEAPVPVVQVIKTVNKLGGAANVANNIVQLNSIPSLLGYCGDDNNEIILKNLLSLNQIENSFISIGYPTITKVRIIANAQQIARVDFEENFTVDLQYENDLIKRIDYEINHCKVVVISDYGKGLVTERLCKWIIKKANDIGKIVIVDPKGNNWYKYNNATVVTPNIKELGDVFGQKIENNDNEVERAGRAVIEKYHLKYLLITRSEKGMTFFEKEKVHHIRTTATEVFDVSGAGDTVVATLATSLASSYEWLDAVKMSNKAAGIVVRKIGTEPVSYKELEGAIYEYKEDSKILRDYEIQQTVEQLRSVGKKIVFTNGCFDIIHKGHIKYLQQAKSKGDILIIGVNSDMSVKRLKGENRPVKDEQERSLILSALEFVDYVVIFTEDTPYELIKKVEPDVLVKGGDYTIANIIGREYAKETITIPFVEGFSTTSTIEKMNKK